MLAERMLPDTMTVDHDPTPAAPGPRTRSGLGSPRRRPMVVALAASIVLLLVIGAGVLAWPALVTPTAAGTGGEVFLEPAATPGQDPFTGDVVVGNPPGTKSQSPVGAGSGGVPTIAGDTPALYGGSRNEHLCDKGKLITFLEQNPDKAAAWSEVLGIAPSQIADYVVSLTPVQLRADTRVTNHGFANGHATTLQSVLQAGTAVLVDGTGRPRVKCGCGNPLGDPVALSDAPTYSGASWPGFDRKNLVATVPAKHPIDRFLLVDLRTGDRFYRPKGSGGDRDVPVDQPPATTTTALPVPIEPSPTPVAPPPQPAPCAAGQQRQGSRCVVVVLPVTPVPGCPAGQQLNAGMCKPISCPQGQALSGNTCKPITCSNGQVLVGGTCTTPPPTCSEGQTLSNGKCVDSGTVCPANQTPSGNTCSPLPSAPVCPPGMVPVAGGDCSSPECTAGTVPNAQGQCVEGRRRRARPPARRRSGEGGTVDPRP
jgi:hypothetical protein